MKPIKYLLILVLIFSGLVSYAQNVEKTPADTSLSFKVYGVCIQCKDRIENVLKVKGVKTAVWDMDSKLLALVYNPAQITLDKIKYR